MTLGCFLVRYSQSGVNEYWQFWRCHKPFKSWFWIIWNVLTKQHWIKSICVYQFQEYKEDRANQSLELHQIYILEWMIFATYYFSKIFWFIPNFDRCFLSRQCYDYKDLAAERLCVWCSHFELLYKIYFDMRRYAGFVNAEWISTKKIHRSRNYIVICARSL